MVRVTELELAGAVQMALDGMTDAARVILDAWIAQTEGTPPGPPEQPSAEPSGVPVDTPQEVAVARLLSL